MRTAPPRTLAEHVAAEVADVAAGRAQSCGKACDDGCHGNLTCARAQHPHDHPDDVAPHAAVSEGGALVQWSCQPSDHDGLTGDTRAAARAVYEADARAQATRVLFASIDPALLVAMLRDGGHL